MAGWHPIEPLNGIGLVAGAEFVEPLWSFGKLGKELGGNFGADSVAAAADGGADGGEEVGGLSLEVHLHFADGFGDDAGQGAAPAGVDSGDGAFFRVDKENGNAIGGLDGQEQTGAVSDGGVSLANLSKWCVEEMDHVGVDLLQGDEFHVGDTEGGLEAATVFEDVFVGVPFCETEIKNFWAVLTADAAGFGAETMDEPGEFCERGNLEELNSLLATLDPVRVGAVGRDRQECLS